jgi:hypothetical protein
MRIATEDFLRVFGVAWSNAGTVPGRRGAAPRAARPDVFMRDLGPELAEPAATALARIGLSEIGEVCDRDRPRSIGAEELFCSPRSVPFELLGIEVLTCVCPPRRTARCRATYALSAGRYSWLETFSWIKAIEHMIPVPGARQQFLSNPASFDVMWPRRVSLRTGVPLHGQDDKGSHSSIAVSWDTNNLRTGA